MKAAIIAFSENGISTAAAIAAALEDIGCQCSFERCAAGGLTEWTEHNFKSCDALIFVSSVGIAVRAVAKHVESKMTDPAVIAVDESAKWVIPVLSGHIGGANELAEKLSSKIGASAVITTATDINRLFAVDVWAKKNGFVIANPNRIKAVSAKLLDGKRIKIKSDFPVCIDKGLIRQAELVRDGNFDVVISSKCQNEDALWLIPKRIVVGIGCRKGTSAEKIEAAFLKLCEESGIDERALCNIASIDIKSGEDGLLEFCERHSVTPMFFSAKQLSELEGEFSHSDFVFDTVGVDNVCERAAIAAGGDILIAHKHSVDGVTAAAALINDIITVTVD